MNIIFLLSNFQELGYEPTLNGLSSLNGDMVANSCRRTLTTLIQVTDDDDVYGGGGLTGQKVMMEIDRIYNTSTIL